MRALKNKTEQIEKTIRGLVILIKCVLDNPRNFVDNQLIKTALKSQGKLCALDYKFMHDGDSIEITPISLTTLKSKLTTLSEGYSYASFDKLRLEAFDRLERAIHQNHQPSKQTKSGLELKILELQNDLIKHKEMNMHLLQALLFCDTAIESIDLASNEKVKHKKAREARETLRRILTLNEYPFDQLPRLTELMTRTPKVVI
jgi:hypothetical protein